MPDTYSSRLAGIELPDTAGKTLRLGSLWTAGPAVIVFLRHYGWIFCSEHVAQLREYEEAFQKKGARLAAVGLGGMDYARFFREKTGIRFPLLVDEKRAAYKAVELRHASLLHLLRRDNMKARRRAKASGHKQHKLGKDPLQLGGSFVFAPGNKDLFVHMSETFGDNAAAKDLLAALG